MSLKFLKKVFKPFGYGYKVVRKEADGVYHPFFEYFLRSGGGGTTVPTDASKDFMKMVVKVKVVYRSFEKTRLKHSRLAFTHCPPIRTYLAGFHLWLSVDYAKERLEALRVLNPELNLCIIKCTWSQPIARDDETVVVKSLVPLAEVTE